MILESKLTLTPNQRMETLPDDLQKCVISNTTRPPAEEVPIREMQNRMFHFFNKVDEFVLFSTEGKCIFDTTAIVEIELQHNNAQLSN